jgi:hypothetical protein
MGFTDFISDAGLSLANEYLKTRSYIVGLVLPRQIYDFDPSLPRCVLFPQHNTAHYDENIWSVLMRRLKTPLHENKTTALVAPLIVL